MKLIRLAIIASFCLVGAYAGYHLGWSHALSSPEVEEAFTFSSPLPLTRSGEPPVEKLDSATAISHTLPAAMRAMRHRDLDTFQERLKELETLTADELEDILRQTSPDAEVFQGIFELLVRLNPEHAFHLIDDLLPGGKSDRFKRLGFSRWSAADPQGAWEALQAADFPRWRTLPGSLEGGVLKYWAQENLNDALSAWGSLTEGDQKNAFSGISRTFVSDPETRGRLFDYLKERPQGEGRQWAIGSLLQHWVGAEGFDAPAEWISTNSGDFSAEDTAEFERKIAFSQVGSDPGSTIAWLMDRSNPDRRSADLEALVFGWSISQPSATGEWLATLDLGRDTDKAVARFARTIERQDPESAYAWAQRITDRLTRDQVSHAVMRAWKEVDPNAHHRMSEASK